MSQDGESLPLEPVAAAQTECQCIACRREREIDRHVAALKRLEDEELRAVAPSSVSSVVG